MKFTRGSSHLRLAQEIADRLFLPLEQPVVKHFKDQEISIQTDLSVEGEDVCVLQSLSYPVNDHLVELLILMNDLKQRKPRKIIGIIPYFGYGRSSSNSKLMAKLLESAGLNQVITVGLHNAEIESFFNVPINNLDVIPLFAQDIKTRYKNSLPLIVSPDKGGEKRAYELAIFLKTDYLCLHKERKLNGSVRIEEISDNIADRNCIIVDDIIDSGETLVGAAMALNDVGASSIDAYAIHAVLSEGCLEKLEISPLQTLVITDTIKQTALKLNNKEVRVLGIAEILAEAIRKLR